MYLYILIKERTCTYSLKKQQNYDDSPIGDVFLPSLVNDHDIANVSCKTKTKI